MDENLIAEGIKNCDRLQTTYPDRKKSLSTISGKGLSIIIMLSGEDWKGGGTKVISLTDETVEKAKLHRYYTPSYPLRFEEHLTSKLIYHQNDSFKRIPIVLQNMKLNGQN